MTAPRVHVRSLAENLEMMPALARESLAMPGTDDERKAARHLRRVEREGCSVT